MFDEYQKQKKALSPADSHTWRQTFVNFNENHKQKKHFVITVHYQLNWRKSKESIQSRNLRHYRFIKITSKYTLLFQMKEKDSLSSLIPFYYNVFVSALIYSINLKNTALRETRQNS